MILIVPRQLHVASARNCARISGMHLVAIVGTALSIAASLGGCSTSTGSSSGPIANARSQEPVNTGLANLLKDNGIDTSVLLNGPPELLTDSQVAALVQRSALDLETLFAQQAQKQRQLASTNLPSTQSQTQSQTTTNQAVAVASTAPSQTQPSQTQPAINLVDPSSNGLSAMLTEPQPTPPANPTTSQSQPTQEVVAITNLAEPVAPTLTVTTATVSAAVASMSDEDKIFVDTSSRIVGLMRAPISASISVANPSANPSESATQSKGGMHEALALAAIESLRPGTLASLDDPTSVLARGLNKPQFDAILAARDRVAQNPVAASGAAREALSSLAPTLGLKNVALCTRVMGFGRYDSYQTSDFVAGRPIRAIVYAEVEGFTARPATEADTLQRGVPASEQRTVDLSQSLTLFHDSGTMQAWHRPFQRVVETSRAIRRDFYVIQQIELPKQLAIGVYRLKVTIRDNTSGAEYETFVNLRVVSPSGGGSNNSISDAATIK